MTAYRLPTLLIVGVTILAVTGPGLVSTRVMAGVGDETAAIGGIVEAGASPRNGRLVLVKEAPPGLRHEIFTVRPDGTGLKRLTINGDNSDPDWHPSKQRIAFVRNSDIWVMNANGMNRRRLFSSPAFDWQPAWAPGGRRVVFMRMDESFGPNRLMIYSLRTDATRRLTPGTGRFPVAGAPSWSPNGRRIAFVGKELEGSGADLFTIRSDGTDKRRVTVTPRLTEWAIDWSPEGGRLLYDRQSPSNCYSLHTIRPDGTHPRRVQAGCHARGPVWSSNGTRIAAALSGSVRHGLWTMSPNGANRTFVEPKGFWPDW